MLYAVSHSQTAAVLYISAGRMARDSMQYVPQIDVVRPQINIPA